MASSEAAICGYVITEDREFFEQSRTEFPKILQGLGRVRQLTLDNPSQTKRIDLLHKNLDQWFAFAFSILEKKERDKKVTQLIEAKMGKSILHKIQNLFSDILTEEERLRRERAVATARATQRTNIIFILTFFLVSTVLIRSLILQKRWETRLRESETQLQEKNTALIAANKELEAFSYSVSHDLRAPLRSADGFSKALLEDYGSQLDDQAKDYIQRIRVSSHRMARLIDDLLNLSKLSRKEMVIKSVDLSDLVRQIAEDLQKSEPERKVKFIIAKGITVKGDGDLLRIVMNNLLNNAWKFTSKHATAVIEFGMSEQDGKKTYFVRDDGAGFDMAYVQKLFGAFQRLHRTSEFPGTGVGLATVQRMVHRHGGLVWAESQVEKGATFYFTIENEFSKENAA